MNKTEDSIKEIKNIYNNKREQNTSPIPTLIIIINVRPYKNSMCKILYVLIIKTNYKPPYKSQHTALSPLLLCYLL